MRGFLPRMKPLLEIRSESMSLFNLFTSRRNNGRPGRQVCKPAVETLEPRRLLSGDPMTEACGGPNADFFRVEKGSVSGSVKVSVWLNKTEPPRDSMGREVPADQTLTFGSRTPVIEAVGGDTIEVLNLPAGRVVTIDGGAGTGNKLIARTTKSNTWLVSGPNAGQLQVTDPAQPNGPSAFVTFSGVQNLTGSNQEGDRFVILPAGSVSGSIRIPLNAAGAVPRKSALDYSNWTTGVTVNLETGSAQGVAGGMAGMVDRVFSVIGGMNHDTLTGGGGVQILRGGPGNDRLFGRGNHDVLLGGDGDDSLYGEDGYDVLIGGAGADYLWGGLHEDILIDGTTTFDSDDLALQDLSDFWGNVGRSGQNGQPAPLTYQERVNQLTTGAGVLGRRSMRMIKLDDTTVTHDISADWFVREYYDEGPNLWLGDFPRFVNGTIYLGRDRTLNVLPPPPRPGPLPL
jgi:hypothetical protein